MWTNITQVRQVFFGSHAFLTCPGMCNVLRSTETYLPSRRSGDKRDLLRETTQIVPVDNPWHVRHCMNCGCIFNRDTNSAQNMILLLEGELNGPSVFQLRKGSH